MLEIKLDAYDWCPIPNGVGTDPLSRVSFVFVDKVLVVIQFALFIKPSCLQRFSINLFPQLFGGDSLGPA